MIERLLESRLAIAGALAKLKERGDKPPRRLKKKEWALLRSLLSVLKPIRDISDYLQTQVIPTLGIVFPIITALVRDLNHDNPSSECEQSVELAPAHADMLKAFKIEVGTHLLKKFNESTIDWSKEIALSTFLDPRSKDFYFISDIGEKTRLLQVAETFAISESNIPREILATHNVPVIPNSTPLATIKALLGSEGFISVLSDVEKELLGYKCLARNSIDDNPLDWWKANSHTFPKLSKLAQKYMVMMTSSASVERVFSLAGWIVDKRRCSLSDLTIENRLIITANKKHLN